MERPPAPLFVVGLGYVGQALAQRWVAAGGWAGGLRRSPEAVAGARAAGIQAIEGALDTPEAWVQAIPEGAALVYSAPPSPPGQGSDAALRALLPALARRRPRALIYLSTTGVYAEQGGAVARPGDPTAPSARALARLDAEAAALEAGAAWGCPTQVFRLAGIYGPGRGLHLRLAQGKVRLWGGGGQLLNRVRVEDIVSCLVSALTRPNAPSGVYNLADGHPAPLAEVVAWLCAQTGLPLPPVRPRDEAPSPTLLGSRQVDIAATLAAFAWRPRYPGYQAGFDDLLAELEPR